MIRLLCLLLCLPIASFAQPVTIRSGEHETFTRLVLNIGPDTEWTVDRAAGGFALMLTGRADGFDTTTVFDRIPRSRIKALSEPAPDRLFLEVECDCFADAFLWQPGQLVLDIADGPDPDAPPPNEARLASSTTQNTQVLPDLLTLQRPPTAFGPLLQAVPDPVTPQDSDLRATEMALIEGLARAASQGVLDAAVSPILPQEEASAPPLPEEIQTVLPIVAPQQPGIGISTAMDRDLAIIRDILGETAGPQCLPPDLFALNDWADARPLHDQVSGLAEGLAGEFGEEPLAAQDNLARLYLYFGFGAEAQSVISASTARSQTREIIMEMAGLIDAYDRPFPLIDAQTGCQTPAAFWAFLSQPLPLDNAARDHILQEFFALPQPLRGQLAPRVSQNFIQIGDTDSAAKLLRAADNNDAEATHDVQAARARVAEEIDEPEEALSLLSREADDSARISPQSLIRLIDLSVQNGSVPQEADLILSAAMRQEYRDTPIAEQLAIAEAGARIALGDYQDAIDLVAGRVDEAAMDVIDAAFARLTGAAPSSVFLGFVFGDRPEGISPQTENAIARRLIDLGFPEQARDFLTGPAEREAAAERRYLRAQAALDMKDFAVTIEELLGLSDMRARDLRAAAYEGLGDFPQALSALGDTGDQSSDADLQFRAGAWERLTVDDDELLSSFAQSVLAGPSTESAETLADRRALLVQSEESRRAVEGLLSRFAAVPETQ